MSDYVEYIGYFLKKIFLALLAFVLIAGAVIYLSALCIDWSYMNESEKELIDVIRTSKVIQTNKGTNTIFTLFDQDDKLLYEVKFEHSFQNGSLLESTLSAKYKKVEKEDWIEMPQKRVEKFYKLLYQKI